MTNPSCRTATITTPERARAAYATLGDCPEPLRELMVIALMTRFELTEDQASAVYDALADAHEDGPGLPGL